MVDTWWDGWRKAHYAPPRPREGVERASIYDEAKFDGREMDAATWLAYCKELRNRDALLPVQTVVTHHSATSESSYAGYSIPTVMRNWWSYYRLNRGWSGGPHVAVFSRGIGLLNNMEYDGIHCSGNNTNSRGFEIVGNFTSVLPTGALLDNAVAVAAGMLYAGKMTMTALKYHRQYGGTACPGNKMVANWAWFSGLVEVKLQALWDADDPPKPPPTDIEKQVAELTATLETLSTDMASAEQRMKAIEDLLAELGSRVVMQRAEVDDHSGRLVNLLERLNIIIQRLKEGA